MKLSPDRMSVHFGPFELDPDRRQLLREGEPISITAKVFDTLVLLVENREQVVEKKEFFRRIWPDAMVEDATLAQTISMLRKVLGCGRAGGQRYIATIPGRGYRFVAEVSDLETRGSPGEESELSTSAPSAAPRQSKPIGWYVAGVALAAALFVWGGTRLELWGPARESSGAALVPVPLTTYPGSECGPSFSPDGNEVAFAWNGEDGTDLHRGNFDIYRKPIGPGAPLRLTSHPAADYHPSWSPDGQSIAFLRSVRRGIAGVILIPSLGGGERQLAELTWGEDLDRVRLAWSPDGRWLVTNEDNKGQLPYSLVLISVANREKLRLTDPPQKSLGDYDASFSPDGRSIVFIRARTFFVSDVYSLALTDQLSPQGEPKRLTHQNLRTLDPVWTPDGEDVLFSAGSGVRLMRLWRSPADGSGRVRPLVALGSSAASHLAVSGQEHRLAYAQYTADIDTWRVAVSDPGRKAAPPERFLVSTWVDEQARYSPDGTRIAFLSERSGNQEIWLSNRDGSGSTQLTSIGGPHVGWPAWSPDSKLLAFDASVSGQREIFVVSVNGGVPQRITRHPTDEGAPNWSHDGKWIYFASNRTGRYEIWKIPSTGGRAVQVTINGGFIPVESPDGKFVFYVLGLSDNSLWKVPAGGGEETRVLDSIDLLSFDVTDDGIFFVPEERRSIEFLDFRTGETSKIVSVDMPIRHLSVSPDGHEILYSQDEGVRSDLMLVENFR